MLINESPTDSVSQVSETPKKLMLLSDIGDLTEFTLLLRLLKLTWHMRNEDECDSIVLTAECLLINFEVVLYLEQVAGWWKMHLCW